MMTHIPHLLFYTLLFKCVSCTVHLKGATNLDSFTFDKMVSKFKVSVVKFDIALPYGPDENSYGEVAELLRFSPDILVAEVGIKDYGDIRNVDLGDRFGVKRSDFPVVKVFVEGKTEPVTFSGKFKAERIKKFIKKHSPVRIVLDYCIQEFDELAEKFMDAKKFDQQVTILQKAQQLSQNLRNEEDVKSAKIYIKMMERVIEKGPVAIRREKDRVKRGYTGVLNKAQWIERLTILNILQSFKLKIPRDEL